MKAQHRTNTSRIVLFALTFCLLLGMAALNVSAETVQPASDPSPAVYVAAKNVNSVVGILTYADTWSPQNGVQSSNTSQGSGVVIREGGYVLTNNHVIDGGSSFKVLMRTNPWIWPC